MSVESKRTIKVQKTRKFAGFDGGQAPLAPPVKRRLPMADAATALLAWYDRHARVLPWRIAPGSGGVADPYHIWLSEVMLQQTTVAAVMGYFTKFTHRWNSVTALAQADEADVMATWAGLGYYARARNLHACAKQVAAQFDGVFPDTESGLRALPGIGDYTAAAIAAIAFGRRAVVVDANVERVAARLGTITEPLPAAKPHIRTLVDAMTPAEKSGRSQGRSGDFAQAMMDLGATICTVKAPKCLLCPLTSWCQAAAQGIAESLPVKAPKKAKPLRHGWAWWIERDGQILLVRRPAKGLLGGMLGLPGSDWRVVEEPGKAPAALPPDATALDRSVQHIFTHFALTLNLAARDAAIVEAELADQIMWTDIDKLDEVGLPTLYKKAVFEMKRP